MTIGWNSLESVSAIHRYAEIAGFVFLGLLLVSEITAYVSGNRKDDLQKEAAQRHLTSEQRAALIAALSPFKGQTVSITCILGDREAKRFGEAFIPVFKSAGWILAKSSVGPMGDVGVNEAVYSSDLLGLEVAVNDQDALERGSDYFAGKALIQTLFRLRFIPRPRGFNNPPTPRGEIELVVGPRPGS